jgi:hypothetical protein
MAVTAQAYYHFKYNAYCGKISDLSSGSTVLKAILVTSAYTPDLVNHDNYTDITDEITGTGYTAGGVTLANVSFTISGNILTLDVDDPEWPDSTLTAARMIILDATPAADANKKLVCVCNFGANKSTTNKRFRVRFHLSGILNG